MKIDDSGEGLSISRGVSECRGMPRFGNSKVKFYKRQKTAHFKRDCPERKDDDDSVQFVIALIEDGFESDGALLVSSLGSENSWFLDSGFSYHATKL